MHFNPWGIAIMLAGAFLFLSGLTKSNFIVYRLFVARSKMLWKDENRVHKFYQLAGLLVISFGLLVSLGIIAKQ